MKKNTKKTNLNSGFIFHGLINVCLVAIVVVTIACCGFFKSEDAVPVYKSYRGVIYAGNETTNKVALMINVYWGTEFIDDILETLDEYNAKATFFVGTTWVEDYPAILRKIYDSGHEIGNHGSHHKEHGSLGYKVNYQEIDDCTTAVLRVTSKQMTLFAPPGGSYNSDTVKAAKDLGYKIILWTKDTIDWRDKDSNLVFNRATDGVVGGDLILAHPTSHTVKALPLILEYYKLNGLNATTVSDCLK